MNSYQAFITFGDGTQHITSRFEKEHHAQACGDGIARGWRIMGKEIKSVDVVMVPGAPEVYAGDVELVH